MAGCAKDQHVEIIVNGNQVPLRTAEELNREAREWTYEYLKSRGVAHPEVYLMEIESAKIPEIPGRK